MNYKKSNKKDDRSDSSRMTRYKGKPTDGKGRGTGSGTGRGFSRSRNGFKGTSERGRRHSKENRDLDKEIKNYLYLTKDYKKLNFDFVENEESGLWESKSDLELEKKIGGETETSNDFSEKEDEKILLEDIVEFYPFKINLSRRQTLLRLWSVQAIYSLDIFFGNRLRELDIGKIPFSEEMINFGSFDKSPPTVKVKNDFLSKDNDGVKNEKKDFVLTHSEGKFFLNSYMFLGYSHQRIVSSYGKDAFAKIFGLIEGTLSNLHWIDKLIADNLKGWTLKRLGTINRSLIRLGLYQLFYSDLAKPVVINEMVDIAKCFLEAKEVKFINAILENAFKQKTNELSQEKTGTMSPETESKDELVPTEKVPSEKQDT